MPSLGGDLASACVQTKARLNMSSQRTTICTIANDNFIHGAIAWINSVKQHAPGYSIRVLDGGLSQRSIELIEAMDVAIMRTNREIDFDHPRFGPAYALFDLGQIETEHFVYLDCDCVVVGSLEELIWQAKNCDIAVGYANAHFQITDPDYVLKADSLLKSNNSAVQAELARHEGLIEKLAKFPSLNTGAVAGSTETMRKLARHAEKFAAIFESLKNPDQELLTIILASVNIFPERIEWRNNATYIHGTAQSTDARLRKVTTDFMSKFTLEVSNGVSLYDSDGQLVESVNVVHFITKDKPWIYGNNINYKLRKIWRNYRNASLREINYSKKINTKLSIIIVTWNNENYIEQAIDSCFSHDIIDFEVVIVHNASDDRTREVIGRAVAGRENKVLLIENDTNVGLGLGRNIGMLHAKGEYVLFLDGDDWFEPIGLNALEKSLQQNPDLVLLNFARVNYAGYVSHNPHAYLMKEGFSESPEASAVLFQMLGVAWNKCYRRAFLLENGLRFPEGFYEDIDWNFKSLVLASRLYVLPAVTTYYRQRPGSILNSVSDKHFDAIERHQDLLDFILQSENVTKNYGKAIYRYARGQLFVVLTKGNRLPRGMERLYLRRANEILKTYRSVLNLKRKSILESAALFENGGLFRAVNVLKLKGRNVRKLSTKIKKRIRTGGERERASARTPTTQVKNGLIQYTADLIALGLRSPSQALRKLVRKIRWSAKLAIYRHVFSKLPLQKRVVFDSYWGKQATCNPMAIYRRLHEIGGYALSWPVKDRSQIIDIPLEHVETYGSLKALKSMATASHLITNVNFPDWYVKRRGQKVLQTHHGTPFKYMGIDIRKTRPKEMNWRKFAKRVSTWDYAISSNPYSSSIWRRAMPENYRVIETGYPRNDIFYESNSELVSNSRRALCVPDGKKIVLYAPTYIEADRTINHAEVVEIIAKGLGPDWMVLYRFHHLEHVGEVSIPNSIDASLHAHVNELCLVADLLITDFSSIVFDYANTGRPSILNLERAEEYHLSRGLYFPPESCSPGLICRSLSQLYTQLKDRDFESSVAKQNAKMFKERFCPWDDGQATNRVIQEVFG